MKMEARGSSETFVSFTQHDIRSKKNVRELTLNVFGANFAGLCHKMAEDHRPVNNSLVNDPVFFTRSVNL
jgi:hypothetical protein